MDSDGRDSPEAATVVGGDGCRTREGRKMNFHIGDEVKVGTRVGTITDVGTVLIQVKTAEGGLRVVCPWELVKILG
jgi:hypothetical protein